MRNITVLALLTAALLGVTGCSEQPERPVPESTSEQPVTAPVAEPEDEVERLLARAARSRDPAVAVDARLAAAAELLQRGDSARARELLSELEAARLSSPQWVRLSVLLSRWDLEAGDPGAAMERLDNPALLAEIGGTERKLRVELAIARADALGALNRHIDSARERTAAHALLNDEAQRTDNARAIFAALSRVDMATIERETVQAPSDDWRGWLELAAIARDLRRGPADQSAQLSRWQQRYALIAPLQSAGLQLLPELQQRIAQPERVALLLPLSGSAAASAEAVLLGYLGEHLRQLAAGEQPPPVAVIDTAAVEGGFAAAYSSAVEDGAKLVIGPLLKDDLKVFGPALRPSVPTLALNFSDTVQLDSERLYEFGLDGADEIGQMVDSAAAQGFRHAVVLADDSEQARRQATEFSTQWGKRGGRLLDTLYLGDLNEFRRQFEQTLLFGQSRERAATLSRLLGREFVAEPRRRQDLDLVVMLASPVPARSIRPLISFLYAGDLPVWATSQSHGARTSRDEDRDLESVRFLDLPWFSGAEKPLRDALASSVPAGGLERLAALGADACRLQSRLELLEWSAAAGLGGATGELELNANRRLRRRSQWYVFTDGVAVPEQLRSAPTLTAIDQSTEGETTWNENAPPDPPR